MKIVGTESCQIHSGQTPIVSVSGISVVIAPSKSPRPLMGGSYGIKKPPLHTRQINGTEMLDSDQDPSERKE